MQPQPPRRAAPTCAQRSSRKRNSTGRVPGAVHRWRPGPNCGARRSDPPVETRVEVTRAVSVWGREGERRGRTPAEPLCELMGLRRGARSRWPRRRPRGAPWVRQGSSRGSSGVRQGFVRVRVASVLLTSHSSPSAALRRVPSANLDGGLSGGMLCRARSALAR